MPKNEVVMIEVDRKNLDARLTEWACFEWEDIVDDALGQIRLLMQKKKKFTVECNPRSARITITTGL